MENTINCPSQQRRRQSFKPGTEQKQQQLQTKQTAAGLLIRTKKLSSLLPQ
jgi:hypothetical protein